MLQKKCLECLLELDGNQIDLSFISNHTPPTNRTRGCLETQGFEFIWKMQLSQVIYGTYLYCRLDDDDDDDDDDHDDADDDEDEEEEEGVDDEGKDSQHVDAGKTQNHPTQRLGHYVVSQLVQE